MGMSTASSHFHQQLADTVLPGYLYNICELYLDDILAHAPTENELLQRLRCIFMRLKAHHITLNPKKCAFGLQQIEFLGHVIDKNGISMSEDKIESVMHFPKPTTAKTLRSFLGLANYFRDHINHLSSLMVPLTSALTGIKKKTMIHWTSKMTSAFEEIRSIINNCPKLFHLRNDLPLFLHTDASDVGIGAYLFQREDNDNGSSTEYPLKYFSKDQ